MPRRNDESAYPLITTPDSDHRLSIFKGTAGSDAQITLPDFGTYVVFSSITVTGSATVGGEYTTNANTGTATITIPSGLAVGTRKLIRKISSSAGTVTINRSGSEVFTRADLTSVTLTSDGDFWLFEKVSSTRWDLVDGFESGGSSGFSWKKSNDGTLVNSFVSPSAATVNITTSLDGHYYYQDSYNFSKSFVDTNYTFLGSANVGGRISHITAGGTKTTSAVSYFVVNGTSLSGVSLTISLRAEGRWYA